jgi:uncharacterized membrane protein
VGHAGQLAVVAPAVAFCIGSGLVRRERRAASFAFLVVALVGALILAASGSWRPILYVIFLAGLFTGLQVDRPGSTSRRALALIASVRGSSR